MFSALHLRRRSVRYAHYLYHKSRLLRKIKLRLLARRRERCPRKEPTKMDALNNLIENSVRQHYENTKNKAEANSQQSESSNAENNLNKNNLNKNNQPAKTERRKRQKDDESTDEEELPRRRAVTMGQHKRRKRIVTKYQKELEMERKDEKFYAEVFDQEYSDSLKDFCVDETSMLESEEEHTDVYTTSSFLSKGNLSTFLDDEAEEDDAELEVKDNFSDSEEERMYLKSCGLQNFYDEDEGKYSSDETVEELSDDSAEFRRRVRRKRNQFVFEEVDVESGESLGNDSDDDDPEDDNGSDLDSFIADDNEQTILEVTDEEEPAGLDSSMFYKKKKRNRVLRFVDSDDEENAIEKTETVESFKCVGSSGADDSSADVLSNSTLKPSENSPKKESVQQPALNPSKNVADQQTITLDSSPISRNLEASIDEESSDEIVRRRKSKTMIIDSSDEAGVTDIMSDEETERAKASPEWTNQEPPEQSVQLDILNSISKISACRGDNSNEDSDLDSLNDEKLFFKRSNARKVVISDDEDSVECVFSENEDDARSSKPDDDDFELNEEDLDATLIED